ncbi:cytochrome P450 [Ganoderma sinense ZZ0214-1]|uniref:Cytochrome P450 n=1 Tax=Ganoderma sinense ZZ0214-1 TaxID=1077348 RepID=A0A2G8RPX2_9APHY|nr:cytochrome P450 [Ganoderma sinense ZZ0214-1]
MTIYLSQREPEVPPSPQPGTMIALGPTYIQALLAGLVASVALWLWKSRTQSRLPLPPGPKPLPIIGNLLDMPFEDRARKFWEIGRTYGDIVYFDVFGQPMVVINTYDAAVSLLETKSANTSDRPRIIMADLLGLSERIFALMGYGRYRPIFLRQAKRFLQRLLNTPENFIAHSHLVIGASIMEVVYGIELTEGDKFLSIAKKGAEIFSKALSPGRYLVELFPILVHLPAWFPGVEFKRDVAKWLPDSCAVPRVPYATVKRAMVQGNAKPCMTTTLLERAASKGPLSPEEDQLFEDVAGLAYGAGTDTVRGRIIIPHYRQPLTYSAFPQSYTYLTTFFLAMTIHPDVRRRGQAELDAVVGPDRLPAFSDRQSLPYVTAIVKECLRWHSVLPLGIPHRAIHEDEYNGWRIPAGTILLANAWAMSRDSAVYPDPDKFVPERFLKDGAIDPTVRDTLKYQLGFGRRICPGLHFSSEALFIFIASVLHVFDILPPLGDDGQPVLPDPVFSLGDTMSILPRSAAAEALVTQLHKEDDA